LPQPRSAIGVTVKSGWAAAVLLIGPPASPRVADSRRIDLSDPAIPESRQPYHAGFGTARTSGAGLTHLVRSVRRFGRRSVSSLIRTYATAGHPPTGAGLVVGSMIDPDRIANAHIRIHALEGRLFRQLDSRLLWACATANSNLNRLTGRELTLDCENPRARSEAKARWTEVLRSFK
jgi:hypothetical protein